MGDVPVGAEEQGRKKKIEVTEAAECEGHVLDEKGRVYMTIKWNGGKGGYNETAILTMMNTPHDKKILEGHWLEYCNQRGYTDDLFRKKGVSVVKLVLEHEWSPEGRPVAVVEYNHGENGRLVVYKALEKNNDRNGLMAAWTAYCNKIGVVDDAFLKGHVNKDHKEVQSKKRRRRV